MCRVGLKVVQWLNTFTIKDCLSCHFIN
ncbi:CxxxxCH/CxxCH domain-containing protein [Rahnella sp. SAP-1]|uniref:CxxxxCH/CxxCH domain-containing protein n=1 Tax=Rouxiella aceris TaxID=2703884 RepID=A0A848MF33_9GAMM|nr:CxxxxCH/CxxCH domain-containing protein [Rouxiella aceris]